MVDHWRMWSNVWITGASTGIGYELARLICTSAGHVAISARSHDKLDALADYSANITSYPADVTDADAIRDCVADIEAAAGPIDLAILNAGVWQYTKANAFDLAAVRNGIEVNYMGVVHALDALLPKMLTRGKGHIALMASVAGYRGLPGSSAYGPSKAAVINLAETLKSELAPRGITVSVVNPGFVDTPMTSVNKFPMPDIISAEEAARELLAGIEKGQYEIAFPRRFIWKMKLLRLLPNWLYFRAIRRFIMKRSD